jgi:hypothetical protein
MTFQNWINSDPPSCFKLIKRMMSDMGRWKFRLHVTDFDAIHEAADVLSNKIFGFGFSMNSSVSHTTSTHSVRNTHVLIQFCITLFAPELSIFLCPRSAMVEGNKEGRGGVFFFFPFIFFGRFCCSLDLYSPNLFRFFFPILKNRQMLS